MSIENAPRALLAAQLLIVGIGPLSWLAVMVQTSGASAPKTPEVDLLGLLIAFGAIPRIVAGPIIMVVEGLIFFLAQGRVTRAVVGAAMLLDLVPLSIFALRLFAANHRQARLC